MVKVKCDRCRKNFNENYWEYVTAMFSYFGTAKFICPKCHNQSITKEVKK